MLTPRVANLRDFLLCALISIIPIQLLAQGGIRCSEAMPIVPGIQRTAPLDQGEGAFRKDAVHARWFFFVAPNDGLATVTSCGGGVDTRLQVYLQKCPEAFWWRSNDDGCDTDNTSATRNAFASVLEGLYLRAGDTLLIEWDDHWDNNGFEWTFSFNPQSVDGAITRGLPHTTIPFTAYASGYSPEVTITNRGRQTIPRAQFQLLIKEQNQGPIFALSQEITNLQGGEERIPDWPSIDLMQHKTYDLEYVLSVPDDQYKENDTLRLVLTTSEVTYAQDTGFAFSIAGGEHGGTAFAQAIQLEEPDLFSALSIYLLSPQRGDSIQWILTTGTAAGPGEVLQSSPPLPLTNEESGWHLFNWNAPWVIPPGKYYIVFRQWSGNTNIRVGSAFPQPGQEASWIKLPGQEWTPTSDLGFPSVFMIHQHQEIPNIPVTLRLEGTNDLFVSQPPIIEIFQAESNPDTFGMQSIADTLWTYTLWGLPGDTLYYRFAHPLLGSERIPPACKHILSDNMAWRRAVLPPGGTLSIPPTCWSACTNCKLNPACLGEGVIVCESFDGLLPGQSIGEQSPNWKPGRPETDAFVTTQVARSEPNALLLEEGGRSQTDLELLFPENGGVYAVQFQVYLPSGFSGGISLLEDEQDEALAPILGILLGTETDGQLGPPNQGYTLPNRLGITIEPDQWMQVSWLLDVNRKRIRAMLNGQIIDDRPITRLPTRIRFFSPNRNTRFYLDDVRVEVLSTCPPQSIICESFEWYFPNQAPGDNYQTWNNPFSPGRIDSSRSNQGENALFLQSGSSEGNDLFLGGFTRGRLALSWSQWIASGQSAGFALTDEEGEAWFQCLQNRNGQRSGEAMVGVFEAFFPYPEDRWHQYELIIDLELRTIDVYVDGQLRLDGYRFRKKRLSYLSFFLPNIFGQTWIDDLSLRTLPLIQTEVQFGVDLSRLPDTENPEVFIAGPFTNWVPQPLEQQAEHLYSRTYTLPAGDTLGFYYLVGKENREPDEALLECGLSDSTGQVNRLLIVGERKMDLGFPCFGFCSPCSNVTASEAPFQQPINLLEVFPNPSHGAVNVRWTSEQPLESLQLWSAYGREVKSFSSPGRTLSIRGIPKGSYWLTGISKNQKSTRKVIVF